MFRLFLYFLSLILISSCTLRIFPEFDVRIIEKIEGINDQAQVLFATVERGSPASAYASLEPKYNEVLGGLSAVLLQVQARPQPKISGRLSTSIINQEKMRNICGEREELEVRDSRACLLIVTPFSLSEARETIAEMRSAHERIGIGPILAESFVNLFNISIEQALTVEAALAGNSGGSQ